MKMSFIWNNPDWPSYTHGVEEVERHHVRYEVQKNATDIVMKPPRRKQRGINPINPIRSALHKSSHTHQSCLGSEYTS